MIAAAALVLAAACSRSASLPADSAPARPAATGPRIVLPDGYAVRVEIAADDPTREQGLMFRDRLADDRGMIFFFAQKGVYSFWMKNTLIPLDMTWIDGDRKVVFVATDVPPCQADPCPSYGPTKEEALYVLETAPGVMKKHGVAVGSTLKLEGLDQGIGR